MSHDIEVKVLQSIRLDDQGDILAAGTTATVDTETAARFPEAFERITHRPASSSVQVPAPAPAPAADAEPTKNTSRPAKAASITEWRKFAEAQGIITTGMSKKDIIAATQSQ